MASLYRSKFYRSWEAMKRRCNNPKDIGYKNYGGRGIKVCKEWNLFENFRKDMFLSYKDGLKIDRIDNNGNYCFNNCRWATNKEQASNTRKNRWISYKGMRKTLNQWIEYLGLKSSTVKQRFYVYKWTIDKCFSFKQGGN